MGKLYFKFGVMGSSKTAEALMCRFNYIQKGFKVLLLKPCLDNRFETEKPEVVSRIGLRADCVKFKKTDDLFSLYAEQNQKEKVDIIIVDECQFATAEQVEQLKLISQNINVLCYGLLTNFKTELFEGSKRLVELADSLQEIKSVCACGKKANVNARIVDGQIALDGAEILIGAEEHYESMCYWCYKSKIKKSN